MEEGILRLSLEVPESFTSGLERGASVSNNGVCLTVVDWSPTSIDFDVIEESLKRTNLGSLQVGSRVNMERAARFGDEIGGHPLSGHIHCQAEVTAIEKDEANLSMKLDIEPEWAPYVISKGYIAINGCSLTIGVTEGHSFWLHLIPETLRITNLSECAVGSKLNVEIDHQTQVIVETVNNYMRSQNKN